jgi:hypothetical protein
MALTLGKDKHWDLCAQCNLYFTERATKRPQEKFEIIELVSVVALGVILTLVLLVTVPTTFMLVAVGLLLPGIALYVALRVKFISNEIKADQKAMDDLAKAVIAQEFKLIS